MSYVLSAASATENFSFWCYTWVIDARYIGDEA